MLTLDMLTLKKCSLWNIYYLEWLSRGEWTPEFFQLFPTLTACKPSNQKKVVPTPSTYFLKNLWSCIVFICMWIVPRHQRTLVVIVRALSEPKPNFRRVYILNLPWEKLFLKRLKRGWFSLIGNDTLQHMSLPFSCFIEDIWYRESLFHDWITGEFLFLISLKVRGYAG